MKNEIINKVESYYSEKVKIHGATSEGVDWNGEESHFLRFEQLTKLISPNERISILDYGSGFGSLIEFLKLNKYNFRYLGYDLSSEMVKKGEELYHDKDIKFTTKENQLTEHDFVIANGIFNVKLTTPESDWKEYILETIIELNKYAKKGFSFNILTSYSDEEYKKEYLHYSNPLEIFDYCKKNFSKNVALLHDYDLYEFTIIVRK